jgi:LacI family transcriptional regulator
MATERQRRKSNQSVTIRDVAAHVGVSPMTVSRVINRESNVKPETRELVHAAIRTLN